MNLKKISIIPIVLAVFAGIVVFNYKRPQNIETMHASIVSDSISVQATDSGKIKLIPVKQSQKVRKGDVIAEIEISSLVSVPVKKTLDEQEATQKEYENAAIMYKDGVISQSEYDKSLNKLKQAQNNTNDKKFVTTSKITKIYSPIDGIVVLNNLKEGDSVAKEVILAKINSSHKEISAYFPASSKEEIKQGSSVDIMVIKYPEKAFSGVIREVSPADTKGIPSKIEFDQDTSTLELQNGDSAIVKLKY